MEKFTIEKYQQQNGKIPFDSWFDALKDRRAKSKILIRLTRLRLGNEGDCKSVGNGIKELRISEGKGYRVYYAFDGLETVLLLCGGNKSTQSKDIKQAKIYWGDYND